jgi:hypothetical protein
MCSYRQAKAAAKEDATGDAKVVVERQLAEFEAKVERQVCKQPTLSIRASVLRY